MALGATYKKTNNKPLGSKKSNDPYKPSGIIPSTATDTKKGMDQYGNPYTQTADSYAAASTEPAWLIDAPSMPGDLGADDQYNYDDQTGTIDDYAERLKDDRLTSLRSAFDQNRTDLEAQKPAIQQDAYNMRNTTDTTYYQSLPELYKAMEAGGQRGGENITGMVGLNSVRGQGMNNANMYETNQLRNLQNALTNLGSQQTAAEADVLAGIDSDTFSAKLQAMRDAVSQANTQRQTEKNDYLNLVGAYSDNYMQEVNNLRGQGVPDTDYRIKALLAARGQKVTDQNAATYEAAQDAEANRLAWARINSGGSGEGLTKSQAIAAFNAGLIDESEARKLLGYVPSGVTGQINGLPYSYTD